MSIYITPQDELHVEYQGISLSCPHCQTLTHLTPVAVPKFEDLSRRKPKQIGIVFRCDACGEPVFLKFFVRNYTALRIELAPNYVEVERAPENFPLSYLPAEAESLFKEALDLTGIVLTKLDGTAKGGIVLGICDELKVPVRYVGLGERAEDLREFHAEDFVEALFGKGEEESAAA